MYRDEWRKWQNIVSHLNVFKISFGPATDCRSCSLPSSCCRIKWVWDIAESKSFGLEANSFGTHSPCQTSACDQDTGRAGHTLFGPGSPPWWQPLLHFSASSWTLSSFPCWGPGSESFFSLRKKTSVLVYNFVFQGCRGPLLPLSQWGSSHQMSSQHEQTAAELALFALANKQQTQIMNSLKCSSTFRLTYFTQA